MKKKALSLFLALGLMCTAVLSGCGSGSDSGELQTIAPLRQQRLRKKELLPRKAQERLKRLQAHRK